jgi:hypothetical protein
LAQVAPDLTYGLLIALIVGAVLVQHERYRLSLQPAASIEALDNPV